jgi:CheY-like chemotaxis protein
MNTQGFNAAVTTGRPSQRAADSHRSLAAAGDAGQDKNDLAEPSSAAPTVLLVEDNHINQVVALEFLAMMGLQTRLATNGLDALAACAEVAPDLVLMDVQMPGMDGLECTRQMRLLQQTNALPYFPILALTAHALESDVVASLSAGMDEHLTKPLDFVSLRARLACWIKMPGLRE